MFKVMSESQEWIKTFKLSSEDLGKLHTQADPSLSLLHSVLLEKYIPEEEYLNWAANKYLLPQISAAFSTKVIESEVLLQAAGLFPWRQDIFPVGQWGNTLYLLCHEPTTIEIEGYQIQYVLAPATRMKEIWSEIKDYLQHQPAASAPVHLEPQTSPAAMGSQASADAPHPVSEQTTTAADAPEGAQPSSVPAEAPEGAQLSSVPTEVPTEAPEGVSLNSVTEAAPEGISLGPSPEGIQESSVPESAVAPEGISLNSVTEAAPEGISLGPSPEGIQESSVPDSVAPEGMNFGSVPDSIAPEGMGSVPSEEATPEGDAAAESSESESGEAPLGISLETSAPELNFASLQNPVAHQETPAAVAPSQPQSASTNSASEIAATPTLQEDSLQAPEPEAPEVSSTPPQAATRARTAEDDRPLLDLSQILSDSPKAEKVKPKVSPALAALKVDAKKAAGLPPVPQPFGAQASDAANEKAPASATAPSPAAAASASKAAPATPAAAASTPTTADEAAPSPKLTPAQAAASANPKVVKSEWSFTEVSKVTPLKQESQTVSRTIEFTHLTTSGGSADLEMCKAVSDDEVSKAIDDARKAGNIAEVALNTFKTMKTYFPDAIFFVFLGSSLIPWRWTQNWSRSLETPPGPIDLSTPSIFRIAFQTGLPYHGYVVPSPVNEAFFKTWNNGVLPDHVTLMPIKIGNLIAGMILGRADRASLDYKYSLKYMEGLSLNISQALQDISVKSAS